MVACGFLRLLRELVTDIKFEEYAKALEERGVNPAIVYAFKDRIWLRSIKMLEGRRFDIKLRNRKTL